MTDSTRPVLWCQGCEQWCPRAGFFMTPAGHYRCYACRQSADGTSATGRVFDWLSEHGPATQKDIGAALGLPNQTAVHAIAGLKKVDRIERVALQPRPGAVPLAVWAVRPERPEGVIESALQSRTALEVAWR